MQKILGLQIYRNLIFNIFTMWKNWKKTLSACKIIKSFNSVSANPKKWSKTLKQFIGC